MSRSFETKFFNQLKSSEIAAGQTAKVAVSVAFFAVFVNVIVAVLAISANVIVAIMSFSDKTHVVFLLLLLAAMSVLFGVILVVAAKRYRLVCGSQEDFS